MWSAELLAKASAAHMSGPQQAFASVSIDTRTLKPGALYVALRGENFDGHRFVSQALAAGATGVLVSAEVAVPAAVTVLRVSDTLLALQLMARSARASFNGPVVAVTGSNGKTTTRQLIASILRAHYGEPAVLCTDGNYNNHIGVPLTLLRRAPAHEAMVVEMGMNHFHELSLLTSLARPTVAVITNAGPAHLEGVGSLAGVAKAKGEIFEGMTASGVAVLNADDHFLPYWEVINMSRRCIRFGFGERADVRGTYDIRTSQLVVTKGIDGGLAVTLPFAGEHNGRNALAAIAVASALGIPAHHIKAGLEAATNIGGRLTRRALGSHLQVIDDSYNANPASVRAGLQVLLNESGQRILVLGDMAELGEHSDALHAELLRHVEQSGVEHVLTLGSRMQRAAGAIGGRTEAFLDLDLLVARLGQHIHGSTTMLVKGAHSMAMHRVIDKLGSATSGEKQ